MAKFKVLVRDDNGSVSTRSEVVEFDGTVTELLQHAHIIEAEEVKKEEKTEVTDKKDNKKK